MAGFILIILLAECSNPITPEEMLTKSISEMNALNSYKITRVYEYSDSSTERAIETKEIKIFGLNGSNSIEENQKVTIKGKENRYEYQFRLEDNQLYSSRELQESERTQLLKRLNNKHLDIVKLLIEGEERLDYKLKEDHHIVSANYGEDGVIEITMNEDYLLMEITIEDKFIINKSSQILKETTVFSSYNQQLESESEMELQFQYELSESDLNFK